MYPLRCVGFIFYTFLHIYVNEYAKHRDSLKIFRINLNFFY